MKYVATILVFVAILIITPVFYSLNSDIYGGCGQDPYFSAENGCVEQPIAKTHDIHFGTLKKFLEQRNLQQIQANENNLVGTLAKSVTLVPWSVAANAVVAALMAWLAYVLFTKLMKPKKSKP